MELWGTDLGHTEWAQHTAAHVECVGVTESDNPPVVLNQN